MPAKKKGGAVGIIEALWAGTGVFAAVKSKSYTGFITSVVIYGVILMLVLAAAKWVMKSLGFQVKEGMATGAFSSTCPDGKPPVSEGGALVCKTGANNTIVLTDSAAAAPLA